MNIEQTIPEGIPTGIYCYRTKEIIMDKENGFIIKTEMCKYYKILEGGIYKCYLMNIRSDEDLIFADECKICDF